MRGTRNARLAAIAAGAAAVLVTTAAGTAAAAPPPSHPGGGHGHGQGHAENADLVRLPAPARPPHQPAHHPAPLAPSVLPHQSSTPAGGTAAAGSSLAATPGAVPQAVTAAANGALVLYDTTNTYGWLGELYGEQTANLVSHFGSVKTEPVTSYTAGQMAGYSAVIYIGSTYDEPIPAAFLSDTLASTKPVIWMGDNIWQLTNGDPTFATDYGWNWTGFDFSTVNAVNYKGQSLTRDGGDNQSGILNLTVSDSSKATVLAQSVRADGSTFPWATRAKNLTYIGEVPYAYEGMSDRYLAASDLLFDALAPATATQHRALVRLEDVGPDADPNDLRAAADTLSSLHVPFSFGVYPLYQDPNGTYNNGVPVTTHLKDVPQVVSAIKYMISKGGTMIDHGYTHQYSNVANPYDGVSGDDFEFYAAHVDPTTNGVVFDGPVAGDSAGWAQNRIASAAAEYKAAGLAVPTIWEFPHYAGSAVDYQAVAGTFKTRYERSLYFGGQLSGGPINYGHANGQFFPYVVHDLYGSKVLPENIGNEEPLPYNTNPARHPADIIDSAKANLVVRDGFASFFFHPYLMSDTQDGTTNDLRTIVTGIQQLGYKFVAAGSL